MKVYLLIAILVKTTNPITGSKEINVQKMVFKDAARCIRNAKENEKRLAPQYDQVSITCEEKEVIK